MATIYLVRHGQASYLKEDYDKLSDLGMFQSEVLGKALKSRKTDFSRCLSGTLVRHVETAASCLSTQGIVAQVEKDKRWNEYDHMELLQKHNPDFSSHEAIGKYVSSQKEPLKALQQTLNNSLIDWIENKYEYPESWLAFKGRVVDGLTSLSSSLSKGENALVFTSGGPISLILIQLLGLDDRQFIELQGRLINTSITKVVVGRSQLSLGSYNEYSHLEHDPKLITFR